MNLKQRTARGALWSAIEVWGNEALQLAVFALLARLLGPDVYGVLGIAIMIVMIGRTLIVLGGWTEALIQRRELEPEHLDAVFWSVLALALVLAAIAWLAAPFMARAFDIPELARVVPWLALAIPLQSLNIVQLGMLQRQLRLAPLAVRSTAGVAVAGIAALSMAFAGWGVWSLVAYELIQPVVAVIVFWSVESWRPRMRFSVKHWHEIFTFSSKFAAESAVLLGENLLPRAVIGMVLGPSAVGFWTLSRKIFDFSAEAVQRPVLRVAMPAFSISQGDPARLVPMLTTAVESTAAAVVPVYMALALLAPLLVSVLFGEAWATSATILQVFAVVGFLMPTERLLATMMLALGRTGLSLSVALLGLAALVGGMISFAPMGLIGMAFAFALRVCVLLIGRIVVVQRLLGVSLVTLAGGVLSVLAAGLLMLVSMAAVMRVLPSDAGAVMRIVVAIVVGGLAYVAGLLWFARGIVQRIVALARAAATGKDAASLPRPR